SSERFSTRRRGVPCRGSRGTSTGARYSSWAHVAATGVSCASPHPPWNLSVDTRVADVSPTSGGPADGHECGSAVRGASGAGKLFAYSSSPIQTQPSDRGLELPWVSRLDEKRPSLTTWPKLSHRLCGLP